MSIIHKILPVGEFEISDLNDFATTIENAKYEVRNEATTYYWIDGKSTRGIDISLEDGLIEIRNTVLSNIHDYELTNKLVEQILLLSDGILFNEDNAIIESFPLFESERINETEIGDCEVIQIMIRKRQDMTIFGPVRPVHFGKRLYESLKQYSGEQLKNRMFDVIQTVNYKLPDIETGSIMQMGDGDTKKVMKLLTNKVDYIIDKYDYIIFHPENMEPIIITNEILNTMLPDNWKLIDEYTIVAPITDQNQWEKLLKAAKEQDLTDSVFKK